MKSSIYFFNILVFLFVFITKTQAQNSVIIGLGATSGTSANSPTGDSGPMYRSANASSFVYSRHHYLYTQAELAAAGILPGMAITKWAWFKDNNAATNSAAVFEIWMKNSSLTAVQTPTQSWATLITGSTRVYNSPTNITTAIGFIDFNFSAPFVYTGGALEVSVNFDISSVTAPHTTAGFSWKRDAINNRTISYCGATASTNLNNLRTVRPQVRITYISIRPNDAGIAGLVSPVGFCAGNHDIKVKLKNFGSNRIDSVRINWEYNGIPRALIRWTNSLDTVGGFGVNDTTITLDTSVSFSAGVSHTLKVWTSHPNGQSDSSNMNDTLYAILKPSIAAGTYSVGPTGVYASLTQVVNDLQFGICGPAIFELQSAYNSSVETFPIQITSIPNSSIIRSVIIRPELGAIGLNISGSNATTIVDLNGAKYVTLDGRPGGIGNKELTITNTHATGSAIRYINNAQFDTIQFLTLTGSNTSATSGVILFSNTTDTNATGGNSHNTISNCYVNGNSISMNCLFAQGNANAATNKFNRIVHSHFYDFFSNVSAAIPTGVHVSSGNTHWTIGEIGSGNYFYQTAVRNSTTSPALSLAVNFKPIYINNALGTRFVINGNRIGKNIPGSVFELGNATTIVGITCRGIEINAVSALDTTFISGNTISGMTVFSSVTNFYGAIFTTGGLIQITDNIIGSDTGTHSLWMNHTGTTALANVYGIRNSGSTGIISRNLIGSFTTAQLNASGNMQLLAVYLTGAYANPYYIEYNQIGSAVTPNSVQSTASSIGGVNVMGLVASGATSSTIVFRHNTVRNLSNLSSFAGTNNAVKGIYVTGTSSVGATISFNTISGLYSASRNNTINQSSAVIGINNSTSNNGDNYIANNRIYNLFSTADINVGCNVVGIYYGSSSAGLNTIENNTIYALGSHIQNSNANISGIAIGTGSSSPIRMMNNMVSIGTDTSGISITGTALITGILKSAGSISTFHNTVYVHGNGVLNSAVNTFAFRRTVIGNDSLVNNMFINTRSNASGGGTHYAIGIDTNLNIISDYNAYHALADIGLVNNTAHTTLSNWSTANTFDFNSTSGAVVFVSDSNLHLAGNSLGNQSLGGIYLPFVATDIDGHLRNQVKPYKGADESITSVLPVKLIAFHAAKETQNVALTWLTAHEKNVKHFEITCSRDGEVFEHIGLIPATNKTNHLSTYRFMHYDVSSYLQGASVVYYRLRSVDLDGAEDYSEVVSVNFELQNKIISAAWPNPFNNLLSIQVNKDAIGQFYYLELQDITGRVVFQQSGTILSTNIELNRLSEIAEGVFLLKMQTVGRHDVMKLLKVR
jgi:hypothetical protein